MSPARADSGSSPSVTSHSRRRSGTSRRRGVPTQLPPPAAAEQLTLIAEPPRRNVRRELLPGVVLVRGWLDLDARLTGTAGSEGIETKLSLARAEMKLANTPRR